MKQRLKGAISTIRTGFNWDVAGGAVMNFNNQSFNQGSLNKWGAWTTLSFTPSGKDSCLDIIGVVRGLYNDSLEYIKSDSIKKSNIANLDFGLKLSYTA